MHIFRFSFVLAFLLSVLSPNGQAWAQSKDATSSSSAEPAVIVIDVSGGPDATSYPVTKSFEVLDFNSSIYKTNKIALKRIQAGEFTMGEPLIAMPRRQVALSNAFYLGVYETTQAQWENVMGKTEFHFDGNSTHPAERVSWEDIRGRESAHDWPREKAVSPDSFMGRIAAKTGSGKHFDLPTEAQWEYACRAGSSTPWHFGDSEDDAEDYAWFKGNSGKKTHEVGTLQPNAWGLYDMNGNVSEWCLDRYGSYSSDKQVDPEGPEKGWYRIWRGGGWEDIDYLLQSALRSGDSPSSRSISVGFRVVMGDQLGGK